LDYLRLAFRTFHSAEASRRQLDGLRVERLRGAEQSATETAGRERESAEALLEEHHQQFSVRVQNREQSRKRTEQQKVEAAEAAARKVAESKRAAADEMISKGRYWKGSTLSLLHSSKMGGIHSLPELHIDLICRNHDSNRESFDAVCSRVLSNRPPKLELVEDIPNERYKALKKAVDAFAPWENRRKNLVWGVVFAIGAVGMFGFLINGLAYEGTRSTIGIGLLFGCFLFGAAFAVASFGLLSGRWDIPEDS
jgi:hypothetical protein